MGESSATSQKLPLIPRLRKYFSRNSLPIFSITLGFLFSIVVILLYIDQVIPTTQELFVQNSVSMVTSPPPAVLQVPVVTCPTAVEVSQSTQPPRLTQPPKPTNYLDSLKREYGIEIIQSSEAIQSGSVHERLLKLVQLLERFDLTALNSKYIEIATFKKKARELFNVDVEHSWSSEELKIAVDGRYYILENTQEQSVKRSAYFIFRRNTGEGKYAKNVWTITKM